MRLKKINVSGFKSFVDSTTITIPADLTGIIGPNGCGKSNVIDAVRWVMGESSARKLRGDSMADVIFNGSEARKPVGKASVELVFDNTDGKSAQAYARFSEISVRRTLSRDGTSEYSLNKASCRRRDITDLFRGTGLGHRSYSIIEQGMVSRIVEARPEDLRSFVEEAAGISHYKDRRRETETRMRHTHENLDRVNDIRKELDLQLRRLQRQSQAARRYTKLKEEERETNGQLMALRYLNQKKLVEKQSGDTSRAQTVVEGYLVQQRTLESRIEALRSDELSVQQRVNDLQAAFYAAGAEVASVEQAIEHAKETGEQQRAEFERLEITVGELGSEHLHDEQKISELESEVSRLTSERMQQSGILDHAIRDQSEWEEKFENWQHRWGDFSQRVSTPFKDQEVQKTRIEQLEAVDAKAQERLARLDEEVTSLLQEEETLEIEKARADSEAKSVELKESEERLDEAIRNISSEREDLESKAQILDQDRQVMVAARSRLQSLLDLQTDSRDRNQDYEHWLKRRGLAHASVLASEVRVNSGWERAADAVLGQRVTGLGVSDLKGSLVDESDLPAQSLFLIESSSDRHVAEVGELLSHVECDRYDLLPFLQGIYTAETLEEALARRSGLAPSESIVTRSGVLIGKNWAQVAGEKGASEGLLQREEEMTRLQNEVPQKVRQVAEHEREVDQLRNDLKTLEAQQELFQVDTLKVREAFQSLRQALSDKQARFDQIEARRQQMQLETNEILSELSKTGADLSDARRHFAIAEDESGELERQRNAFLGEKDNLSQNLSQARLAVQQARDDRHQIELALQHSQASLESHQASLQRLNAQSERMKRRYDELERLIQSGDQPDIALGERLQMLLNQKTEAETALAVGRHDHSSIETQIRDLHSSLSEREQEVAVARDLLQDEKLKGQEVAVRLETLSEQASVDKYNLDELISGLPDTANEADWYEQSEKLAQKISNIGPVNLVAIEEYEEQAERKEYLDAQHADLVEALETLSGVIRKIDRETKERFKATFDELNNGFTDFFPSLFGGGSAVLELTEEDLLTAGVTVMARPPGKRNSTIQLLSGGEKALTAVALLFSLFRLNPAPFCILDEVDAPLDDRNVERYCKTLRSLAEVSQLIVITHNKITMESADVLLGVTMGEPGVSSIVSVDIDEAVKLAAI
ncbi:MAG: chromosome segregation protein SMC [Proteobacteria bacterium]|nr:chromosome segregation protein SMC [Pseudomonadota bacterium]